MLLALLLSMPPSAEELIREAERKIERAKSITVTMVLTTEEFSKESRVRYWYQKGGYFRAESGTVTDVGNPKGGWTFQASKKIYQKRPALPANFRFSSTLGLDVLGSKYPPVGAATNVTWRKRPALRVQLDGRQLTKETKLYVFFDPKTRLPIGVSANLGSLTQVRVFENLKVNPTIDPKLFQFTPPTGWRQVTASTGGWP